MKNYDKNGWKEKIDPAFDKAIKNYIVLIKQIENIPNDGQIKFDGELKNFINENLDYSKPGKVDFNEIVDIVKENGFANDIALNVIFQLSNPSCDLKKLFENCNKLVEKLPEEESRQFYRKKFNEFITDDSIKPPFSLSEKHVDFLSIISSLLIRNFLTGIDKTIEKEITKEDIEMLKNPMLLKICISMIHTFFYHIAYQKNLIQIVNGINNGNDESLFKAIRIDKSVMYAKPVMERITKAQINGDKEFLNSLGNAIKTNPLEKIGQHGKVYSVITFFWLSGLYKLKHYELYCLLESCGLNPPPYPDGFDKFMKRHIRSIFNNITPNQRQRK